MSLNSVDLVEINRRLMMIAQISTNLVGSDSVEHQAEILTKQVCQLLMVDCCIIRLRDKGLLKILASHGIDSHHLTLKITEDEGLAKEILTCRSPITVENVFEDDSTADLSKIAKGNPKHFQFKSFAGAPINAGNEIIGILGVFQTDEFRRFSQEDLTHLQIISNTIGIALANDLRYKSIGSRLKKLEELCGWHTAEENVEEGFHERFMIKEERSKSIAKEILMDRTSIYVCLQEIVSFDDSHQRTCRGFEALARWNHSTLGVINPSEFVRVAEETDQIHEISRVIFRKACELFTQKKESLELESHYILHLNLSPIQLLDLDLLLEDIRESMQGISPREICFEITESSPLIDEVTSIKAIRKLQSLGYKIFLDDFGKGYSSLSRLTRLSPDGLKFDKCLIEDIISSEKSEILIRSLISLCKDLKITTIVEGIESEVVSDRLLKMKPDMLQGYYYSIPSE